MRGNQPGVDADRCLERAQRITAAAGVAEAQPQEIMRIGHAVVDAQRVSHSRKGAVEIALTVTGERQSVGDARGAIVQAQKPIVGVGRAVVALELIEHVAERLERASGTRVEGGSGSEVADRMLEVAAPLIGLPAAQIRNHRVLAQRDRAAVGFDRREGLVVAERVIAARQQHPVIALPRRGVVGGGRGHRDYGEQRHGHDRSFHGAPILPAQRNFRAFEGSNLV